MSFQSGNFGFKVLEPKCLRMTMMTMMTTMPTRCSPPYPFPSPGPILMSGSLIFWVRQKFLILNAHTLLTPISLSLSLSLSLTQGATLQSATSHATRSRLCHLIQGHHEAQDKSATRPCQEEKDKHYRDPTDFPMLRPVLLLALATAVVMLYVVVAAQGAAFLRHRQTHLAYPTPWANDHRGLMWQ